MAPLGGYDPPILEGDDVDELLGCYVCFHYTTAGRGTGRTDAPIQSGFEPEVRL
jgi:hypothetical protein